MINERNFEVFTALYLKCLTEMVKAYPKDYNYGHEEVPRVANRMNQAFLKGSFNKDSRAIKATCRELKLKHTYKEILGYLHTTEAQ